MTGVGVGGRFRLVSRDPGGRVLGEAEFANGVTTEGVNHVLNRAFRGGAGYATWYGGLIDAAGTPVVAASDTHASHPGWAEWAQVYLSRRATWAPAAAAGGAVASPNMVLTVTASGSVKGAFLASQQATGAAGGQVLYATGLAASALAVVAGGTVTISYIVRLTPGAG